MIEPDPLAGTRERPRFALITGALGLLTLGLPVAADTPPTGASSAGPRTVNDGVYTAAQAARGARVNERYCAHCHHVSYFRGPFLRPWHDQSVHALYELIRLKMPEDRPGALRPREYADLLAYILALNGYPAGNDKLDHDAQAMQQILIRSAGQ